MYYLRSKPSANPVKFSVKRKAMDSVDRLESKKFEGTGRTPKLGRQSQGQFKPVVLVENPNADQVEEDEGCLMCSS
jgi:hypothetical protein